MVTATTERNGFRKGLSNVKYGDIQKVKAKIKEVLGLNNAVTYNQRRRGVVPLSPAEADAVEAIFKEAGLSEDQIWD